MTEMVREAKKLHDLGFAVLWLRPWNDSHKGRGKAPMDPNWQKGPRKSWQELLKSYRKGFNVGVRLGSPSKLKEGYLINIDIDVKGQEKTDEIEAIREFEKLFPGPSIKTFPTIRTGRGLRLLAQTAVPVPSQNLSRSERLTKVLMQEKEIPDSQLAYVQHGLITESELRRGLRLRPAWEIDLLSDGKQGVFPPSIHPTAEKPYAWDIPLGEKIPLVSPPKGLRKKSPADDLARSSSILRDWKFQKIDLDISPLSDNVTAMIRNGKGVSDRSAALLSAALSMTRAGFTEFEMLSVLMDHDNYLGRIGYERRSGSGEKGAAEWVLKYAIQPALAETRAENIFDDPPDDVKLSDEELTKQHSDLASDISQRPWQSSLKVNDKGKPYPSLYNSVIALKGLFGHDAFAHDEFSFRDFFAKKTDLSLKDESIRDIHCVNLKLILSKKAGFEPAINIVNEAVSQLCHENIVNPAKDFFLSLPRWDGRDRIHGWLQKYFEAEGPDIYIDEVFRKWLVGAVARVFEPGLKFDWIPIFEGAQGKGKSLFGRILFGEQFFSDQLPPLEHSMADAVLQLQGKLCIELAELAALNRSTLEGIKAFITRQVDQVRVPYGRRSENFPRRCVFYGTTNRSQYLADETGNRRFNPIHVGQLDVSALLRDRSALWAEAVFIYQNGLEDHFYLSDDARLHAEEIQAEKKIFSDIDHIEDSILEFICAGGVFNWSQFRISDLFLPGAPLGNKFRDDPKNSRNARDAIKKMGARQLRDKIRRFWSLDVSAFARYTSKPSAPRHTLLN